MRRFFNLIFQLVMAALVIFLFTAAWIVLDGITDLGEKADVALVTGHSESAGGNAEQPQLDRVVKLYNEGEFPFIVVSGPPSPGTPDDPDGMATYLTSNGIPSNAIIENRQAETMQDMAHDVAEIMKSHHFESVMVITDYYHVTCTKLALSHEEISEIQKAHVGKWQKGDAEKIGREVVALYEYIGKVYLLPAAEKAKEEAQVGADKAKAEAEKAKKKVDKGLDGLVK